jgi:hypothetical protein
MVGGYFGINHVTSIRAEPRKGASSSTRMSGRKPTTSTTRIAANLRSTRSVAKAVLLNRMGRIEYRLSGRILTVKREGWHFLSVKLPVWFTFSVR